MIKKFDKRYLSIFIDKFIPKFFVNKYPRYKEFIFAWLEYLEQDNEAWELISNFNKFIDIDEIDDISDVELRSKIIDQIYKMFLGSEETRYLSTLMDDILFLKLQKSILKKKGTKAIFLLMLLMVLNGYFRIENVTEDIKIHDGTFSYNGTITYGTGINFIERYVYLVISEFNLVDYEKVLRYLNPAGMIYINKIQKSWFDDDGNYLYNNNKLYSQTWNTIIS